MKSLEVIPLRLGEPIKWEEFDTSNSFPLLFKEFNNVYNVAGLFESEKNFYLDSDVDQKKSLGLFQFTPNTSIVVDTFFDPTEILYKLELIMDEDDEREAEILSNGYLPFAYCSSGQLLMVTTNKHQEQDKIYLYTPWNDNPLEFIADNIFHFFRNYILKIDVGFVPEETLKSLYKNWGEDFWRTT